MTLAVLIPYRPDTPHRERIHAYTSGLWAATGAEVIYHGDGLEGSFNFARAANAARRQTGADGVLIYSVDAIPPTPERLDKLDAELADGTPWGVMFDGQQRFTPEQTERLLAGADRDDVGFAVGRVSLGHEAIIAVRTDVWDELRGMDERFRGWGPEDRAFHRALSMLYPGGRNVPTDGLFEALEHPDTPRGNSYKRNARLWDHYLSLTRPQAMRAFYLSRPRS